MKLNLAKLNPFRKKDATDPMVKILWVDRQEWGYLDIPKAKLPEGSLAVRDGQGWIFPLIREEQSNGHKSEIAVAEVAAQIERKIPTLADFASASALTSATKPAAPEPAKTTAFESKKTEAKESEVISYIYTPFDFHFLKEGDQNMTPADLFEATRWYDLRNFFKVDLTTLEKIKVGLIIAIFAVAALFGFLVIVSMATPAKGG